MTLPPSDTEFLAKCWAPIIREFVERELDPIKRRVSDAEARLAGAMNFRGVFQRAQSYRRGDCVVSDGALWFCIRDVDGSGGKPGTDAASNAWQLTGKTR